MSIVLHSVLLFDAMLLLVMVNGGQYFVDLALNRSSDDYIACLRKNGEFHGLRVRVFGYDSDIDTIHVRVYMDDEDKKLNETFSKRSVIDWDNIIHYCVKKKNQVTIFKPLMRSKRGGNGAELTHDPQWNRQQSTNIREWNRKSFAMSMASATIPEVDKNKVQFSDPWAKMQWYCASVQNGGANIIDAWNKGYSGKGVSICIIDDGLDHTHIDLKDRYRADLSCDLNDPDDPFNDPMPSTFDGRNSHGTKCAGVAAAGANNGVCGVGIAYGADIAAHRLLDGVVTGMTEGKSLGYKNNETFIKSLSWGPNDDGCSMEKPGFFATRAIEAAVKKGRNGKGTIFVWASGNGGCYEDHCGADAYVSNENVIAIGSINKEGHLPFFTEFCPAVLAVGPSGGMSSNSTNLQLPNVGCVTTDVLNRCSMDFIGTSAAAPLASGIIALALEANPNVTHRDIMHIITRTSKVPNHLADTSWKLNGAGYLVSDRYGFGVLDACAVVELAKRWKKVGRRITFDSTDVFYSNENGTIRSGQTFVSSIEINTSKEKNRIDSIEHVIA